MLTDLQAALVKLLGGFEVSENSMIGIMLELKDTVVGQMKLVELFRCSEKESCLGILRYPSVFSLL